MRTPLDRKKLRNQLNLSEEWIIVNYGNDKYPSHVLQSHTLTGDVYISVDGNFDKDEKIQTLKHVCKLLNLAEVHCSDQDEL